MLMWVDVGNSSPTDDVGNRIGEQFPTDDQNPRGTGASDELVRAEHDGIEIGEGILADARIHPDINVGSGRCEIPECDCAVAMQ